MGFIPEGARWYLAALVLEHTIESDSRNVVHVNTHLIEAESPEQAYEKAVSLGLIAEQQYPNTEGKLVRVTFRGVRQLNVIDDELEDGAELTYEESVGVPEDELRQWLTAKEELGVFSPIATKTDGPNYMPQGVMEMLRRKVFGLDDMEGRH